MASPPSDHHLLAVAPHGAIAQALSARVEEAIRKVLGSDVDELDGPTFDAVAFTNRAFPDDRALEGLDKAIAGYDAEVRALDESILETVREQSSAGALAARDIADAKDSIGDLHSKIVEIKKKAEASEQMVQDICKDIKQLDVAKRHLTNAILTLARLKTLTEAVAQLQQHTAAKSYDEAAPVLEAAIHVFSFFADYSRVPKVAELARDVESVRGELSEMIRQDFEDLVEAATPQDLSFQEGGALGAAERAISLDELRGGSGAGGGGGGGAGDGPAGSRALTEGQTATLAAACECIDSLGPKERRAILRSFNAKQLKSYRWIFRPGSPLGDALDAVDKRFAWFRRSLGLIEDKFGRVLPKRWRVAHRLCVEFCEATRTDVDRVLGQFDPPSSAPPELLLRALLKTIAFEKEMAKRFEGGDLALGGGPGGGAAGGGSAGQGAFSGGDEEDADEVWDDSAPLYNDKGELVDPMCAEGIKLKYKRKREFEERRSKKVEKRAQRLEQRKVIAKLAGVEERGGGGAAGGSAGSAAAAAAGGIGSLGRASINEEIAALPKLATPGEGIVSAAFKPYMTSYVRYERQKIDAAVSATQAEDAAPGASAANAHASVLRSATQLFAQASNAVGRCVQLSTGQTLFELFEETTASMAAYAASLQDRMLPRPLAAGAAGAPAAQLPGETYAVTEADVPRLVDGICLVVNTSEYCAETVPKFAESLAKVLDPAYKEHVSPGADATQQVFYALSARALKTLSGVVACVLDAPLARMSKETDWARVTAVSDQSPYVNDMARPLRLAFSVARRRLDETRFRKFCQEFAEPSVRRYQASIYRCSRVSEVGAQQLLLDAQTIRALLLDAPRTRAASDRALTNILAGKPIDDDDVGAAKRGGGEGGEGGDDAERAAAERAAAAPPPAAYTRTVQKEMQSAELLLKIVAAPPPERFREMIRVHWPGASAEQIGRVMAIKGMSEKDKKDMLVALGLKEKTAFPDLGMAGMSGMGMGSFLTAAAAAAAAPAASSAAPPQAGAGGAAGAAAGAGGAAGGGGAAAGAAGGGGGVASAAAGAAAAKSSFTNVAKSLFGRK
jgi:hypothetical protein